MPEQQQHPQHSIVHRLRTAGDTVLHHLKKHTGVGIICAVAYFDPGNWGVDLQAGSQFGYRLLFIVLLASLFAVFLQVLASRLGCVTGVDLATHCRLLLYNRPRHTLLYRWLGLYPLYLLAEIAIIATDLAELLGSAIALCLLFPSLHLWQGVLITAGDVLIILAMGDPLRGKPVRMFEFLIAVLVLAVLVCMVVIISQVNVNWANAFEGFVPSKYIFTSSGIYTAVGILGATVMPHSLYLGSTLATQDRIDYHPNDKSESVFKVNTSTKCREAEAGRSVFISGMRTLLFGCREYILWAFRIPPPSEYSTRATRHSERENNPLPFVRAHIRHGTVDVVGSLLGFAVMINSLILILASAVFFYGKGSTSDGTSPASLFDAYDLIRDIVGKPAATLFAIALLASGQSSSLIATVAGQAVSEGYLQWRVSPVVRRLVTRLLAMVPSVTVAAAVGRPGVDTLLVASQVVLSVVLPFVTFPLLYCTSSRSIMSVRETPQESIHSPSRDSSPSASASTSLLSSGQHSSRPVVLENVDIRTVDYSNNRLVIFIGVVIWLIVAAANFYVIVSLAMGQQG